MSQSSDDFRFQPVKKDPAESLLVKLNLFTLCANFWQPNEQYAGNEQVRPSSSTGFAYQAGGVGTSAGREPIWPRSLGGTVTDGPITWTAIAAAGNGVNPISAPSAVADPAGSMTITSVSPSEDTKILATYGDGIDGQDYDAVFTFTLNGVQRVARQRVQVRKR